MHNPTGADSDQNGREHSYEWRNNDKNDGIDPTGNDDSAESGARDGGASVTTQECMR